MTAGLDFHAVTMPELPFYGDTRPGKPVDQRVCLCGTVLSRYNGSDTCWPCERSANPLHVVPAPPPPRINHETEAMAREARVLDALPLAASLAQPFTTPMLADALGVSSWAAANTVNALVRRGLVVKAGHVKSQRPNNRGMLALWRVVKS